jgi:hypothetical protein
VGQEEGLISYIAGAIERAAGAQRERGNRPSGDHDGFVGEPTESELDDGPSS